MLTVFDFRNFKLKKFFICGAAALLLRRALRGSGLDGRCASRITAPEMREHLARASRLSTYNSEPDSVWQIIIICP